MLRSNFLAEVDRFFFDLDLFLPLYARIISYLIEIRPAPDCIRILTLSALPVYGLLKVGRSELLALNAPPKDYYVDIGSDSFRVLRTAAVEGREPLDRPPKPAVLGRPLPNFLELFLLLAYIVLLCDATVAGLPSPYASEYTYSKLYIFKLYNLK